jgi:hypothetical protein
VDLFQTLVDVQQPSFLISIASMILVPVYWNLIARTEHKTRWLSSLCRSPYIGCYLLAFTIFLFSGIRDFLYALFSVCLSVRQSVHVHPLACLCVSSLSVCLITCFLCVFHGYVCVCVYVYMRSCICAWIYVGSRRHSVIKSLWSNWVPNHFCTRATLSTRLACFW